MEKLQCLKILWTDVFDQIVLFCFFFKDYLVVHFMTKKMSTLLHFLTGKENSKNPLYMH